MFRIGEFSKIAQVAGSQLRYYDEIGLLKPAKIDEWTGYRYYSATQLPRLNQILALKELGLSLDQIRRMVDDDISPSEIRGMFALKKAQAEQAVREELSRLRQIESRIAQLEKGDVMDDVDVVVKKMPAQSLLSLRKTCTSFNAATMTMLEMHKTLPAQVGEKALGRFMAILHSDMFGAPEIDIEMGFLLNQSINDTYTLPSGHAVTTSILPAVETMVTSVRVGTPSTAHPCRAALATWVEMNGYEFAGNGREIFIVPPLPNREHETVMEIQYPIRRVENLTYLA